jgi:hypothetical protein
MRYKVKLSTNTRASMLFWIIVKRRWFLQRWKFHSGYYTSKIEADFNLKLLRKGMKGEIKHSNVIPPIYAEFRRGRYRKPKSFKV